jgi:hypothetical protein
VQSIYKRQSIPKYQCQKPFHQGRYFRDISLNAKDLVLLKNVTDKNTLLYLALQVHLEDSEIVYKAYLDST